MKKSKLLVMCLLLLLAACGGGGGGGNHATAPSQQPVIVEFGTNGFVQKGPFIRGSAITIQDLTADFAPTGTNYQLTTKDDLGSFSIPASSSFTSGYAEIIAEGFYFNEVAGALSGATLTLRSLSEISDNAEININILTTLAKERIEYLIEDQDKTFAEARAQAEEEVLRIFHIPEADITAASNFDRMDISLQGDSNAILLAVSSTLQGANSMGELAELISKISEDIKEDGVLDNARYNDKLKNNGMALDLASVRTNLEQRYRDLGLSVSIPSFEDFVDSDGDTIVNKYDYKLLSPAGTIADTKPSFDWTDSKLPGAEYHIQIALDANFSSMIEDAGGLVESAYSANMVLDNNTTYYWRVFIVDADAKKLWAEPLSFSVDLNTVVLKSPAANSFTNDTAPTFSWEANSSAATYIFMLSTQSELSSPIVKKDIVKTIHVLDLPLTDSTAYYWAVIPVDENGVEGTRSEIRKFTLDTTAPVGSVVINNNEDKTSSETVELAISSSDANNVAKMYISKDGSFTDSDWIDLSRSKQAIYSALSNTENATITAYVKLRDAAGNESPVFTDSITLRRTFKSGLISSSQTWGLSGSPYVINNNIQVASGVTLTIEAGVTVEYAGAYSMLVKGAVSAVGSASQLIKFSAPYPLSNSNAVQLKFQDTNLANSSLNYVTLEKANEAVEIWTNNTGVLNVQNALIYAEMRTAWCSGGVLARSDFCNGGVRADSPTLTIANSIISNTIIRGVYPAAAKILITGGAVSNSKLYSEAYHTQGINIQGSTVTNSDFSMGGCGAKISLNNAIVSNGGLTGSGCGSGDQLAITSSQLNNASINHPSVAATITNSAFNFTDLFSGSDRIKVGYGTLSGSTITGNGSRTGLEITGAGTFSATTSTITGHSVGIQLSGSSGSFSITGSNIYNNSTYNLANKTPGNVTATGNNWGTTNTNEIERLIFDGLDDINYGRVLR